MQNLKAIHQAIKFIEDNVYEPITVSDVATSVSYSYFHFHRFFYAVMHETIGEYIRSRRMTQAAYELNWSTNTIAAISLSLGFETPESFTRAFKKRYSMTPSEYRKQGLDLLIGNRASIKNSELGVKYGLEPEIINLPSVPIVGVRFPAAQVKDGYTWAWRSFKKEHQKNATSKTFYGVFETEEWCEATTFNLDYEASIFIGTEYSTGDAQEKEKIKKIKGGKYAKFIYVGPVKEILSFYQYIWGAWLTNSSHELDNRNDFEVYTERFIGEYNDKSEIDIYIPIK